MVPRPRGFSGGSIGQRLLAMWETQVRSLGQEDPLEKGMATHSGILPGECHGQRSLEDSGPHRATKSWTWLSAHYGS